MVKPKQIAVKFDALWTTIVSSILLFITIVAIGFMPQVTVAQATSTDGSFNIVRCGNDDTLKNNQEPTSQCTFQDLFDTGIRIVNLLMITAGVFATIRIVIAGGQMVLSAGNEEMLTAGRSGLSNAILGLILVIIAFLVINTLLTFLVPGGEGILRDPLKFINPAATVPVNK